MEENSEAQMETDLSPTSDTITGTEVAGSPTDMETVIVVEELKEENCVTEAEEHSTQPQVTTENPSNEEAIKETCTSDDKSPPTPVEDKSPSKVPQTSEVQGESQTSPKKESPNHRTYSRSLLKVQQKPAERPTEVPTEQPTEVPTEQPSTATTNDAKAKKQNEDSNITSPEKAKPISVEKGLLQPEESNKSPIKTTASNDVSVNKKLLDNPLLVNALFGNSVNKPNTEAETVLKEEDTVPQPATDSPIEILSEKSNDTLEMNSDSSEVHNKSISRELRSLINYAKESKIISECTQLTSKTRKSRSALDSSSSSLSGDTERPIGSRRDSDNSSMSNGNEKVEKSNMKRSMRSQNPEFVNKVKLFLNSVTGKVTKTNQEALSDDEMEDKKVKENPAESQAVSPKKKKPNDPELTPTKTSKIRSDPYCWRCHWAVAQEANEKQHAPMLCTVCPRSFHYKCLSGNERSKIISEKNWVCPECLVVLHAESSETRSPAMKRISLGCLCDLLKYALERMMDLNGVEPFMQPVDRAAFPDYKNYVVHPMDLSLMKENINEGLYGSTEAFLADAQWILHNSIIFNTCDNVVTVQSKLTGVARALVRSCKAEMGEIEACPECYAAAHSRKPTWFTDVCSTPHLLLWAKLKGFPYWPAKCMSISGAGLVDVRFFGAHDRAWVPARDCFLFSEKDPNNFRTKRQDILDSMQEAEQHIRNISRKYGKFVYPPFKTQLDPSKITEQLKIMIPSFDGEVQTPVKDKSTPKSLKNKRRSNSKSSKDSSHDGDASDIDEAKSQPRKMADGVEIAMDEDFSISKDKTMEVDERPKENEISRKRRRSDLEEAVITVLMGSSKEKRKCPDNKNDTEDKPPDTQEKADVPAEEGKKEEEKTNKTESQTDQKEGKMISTLKPVSEKDLANKSPGDRTRPPIRMILKTKSFKTSTPKSKESPKQNPLLKVVLNKKESRKSSDKDKDDDKNKSHKRRNSKNKSLNASVEQTANSENNISVVVDCMENKDKEIGKDDTLKVDEKLTKTDATESKEDPNAKEDSSGKNKNVEKSKNNSVSKPTEGEAAKEIPASSKETGKSKENSTPKPKDDEKVKEYSNKNKESQKAKANTSKAKDTEAKQQNNEQNKLAKRHSTSSLKSSKETSNFDDDNTSLAMLARENSKRGSLSGLPTITSVRSLSSPQSVETATSKAKTAVTSSDASIFTPTSTDSVRNMKEAVNKLNKLRTDSEQSLVGKVGVCAFARMPSTPPADKQTTKANETIQVEIKTEPIDLDDADRHAEKMNLMNAFSLRPVTSIASTSNLREVRINKVVSAPQRIRKPAVKPAETKSRAKKPFTQQKKEDGRSELNGKNSMVYIPIQPPVTQAPVRVVNRPVTVNGNPPTTMTVSRVNGPVVTNNIANTLTPNLPPSTAIPAQVVVPPATTVSSTVTVVAVTSNCGPVQTFPALGQIPTTVHTVPLITSVNGQWTFSLQPIMSVGGLDVDNDSTPPLLNGIADRNVTAPPPMVPLTTNCATPTPAFPMAARPMPGLVASDTSSPSILEMAANVQGSPAPGVNRPASEDPVGEPPRLQHKPLVNPLDANAPAGSVPPPSTAGPVTAKLNQNAIKLTDFFRTILEDTIDKIDEPAAQVTTLKLQLEESRWKHQQEIEELKHNHELLMAEMRSSLEKERARAVEEARRAAQLDLEAAVKLAKSKQWCANCGQEAQFYCCWNTSYCDYGCQRAHWGLHYASCAQQRTQGATSDSNTSTDGESNRLQPSENLPKTTAAPTLNKGPVARVLGQDSQSPKSIIVSMVEDKSGNQTMKCVGTYKPSAPQLTSQMSPLILNKPVGVISDEITATKKVVTSGGYLIVGAQTPNSTLVTPPRRPQTIQYFS